jgi:hypothetical protein
VDPEAAAEAQRQSLELLEWPAVCRQVRCGCRRSDLVSTSFMLKLIELF